MRCLLSCLSSAVSRVIDRFGFYQQEHSTEKDWQIEAPAELEIQTVGDPNRLRKRRKRRSVNSKRQNRTAATQSVFSIRVFFVFRSASTRANRRYWRCSHPVTYGLSHRRHQNSAASAARGHSFHLDVSLDLREQHSIHRYPAQPLAETPTQRSESKRIDPRCSSTELLHQKMGVLHADHDANGVDNLASELLASVSDLFAVKWNPKLRDARRHVCASYLVLKSTEWSLHQ